MDGEECIMSWKKMIMLAQDSGLKLDSVNSAMWNQQMILKKA